MADRSRVTLPPAVGPSYEVYVNGVLQQEGTDFVRIGPDLVFPRSLTKEGRLGPWRWLSLLLGIHGTYRQNDSIDVVFEANGRRVVATGLEIVVDDVPQSA